VHAVGGGLGGGLGGGGELGGALWVASCDGATPDDGGGVFDPEVPHATSEMTTAQSHHRTDLTVRVLGAPDAFIISLVLSGSRNGVRGLSSRRVGLLDTPRTNSTQHVHASSS
jgi:hypothetical protein